MLYNLKSILQGATCMYSISVNKTLIYSKKLGHIVNTQNSHHKTSTTFVAAILSYTILFCM